MCRSPGSKTLPTITMTIITTPSRKNFFSWVLYVIGTILVLVLPVNLILSCFRAQNDIVFILCFSTFLFLLGILSLRILIWFINGKEEVCIKDDNLVITKTGTFWIKTEKRFPLKDIKNILLVKNLYEVNSHSELVGSFSRQMYIFKIQNIGRIKLILTGTKSYRFLDNVNIIEAKKIIEKIKTVGNIS